MDTLRTPALALVAIAACLTGLLMPDSYEVEVTTGDPPLSGPATSSMQQARYRYAVESAASAAPGQKEPPSLEQEKSAASSGSINATGSIDWLRILYPELARISDLEYEPVNTAMIELVPMLADDDPAVRRAAIEAIGDMTIPAVLPLLSTALDDPNPEVRLAALEALALQDDASVAGNIEIRLYDQDPAVRLAAIEALAELESETAVVALASLLSDPQAPIRQQAVGALGDIGGENAVMFLLQARHDPEPAIRKIAANILSELEYAAAE